MLVCAHDIHTRLSFCHYTENIGKKIAASDWALAFEGRKTAVAGVASVGVRLFKNDDEKQLCRFQRSTHLEEYKRSHHSS
jgi:hypothetical protein